MASQEHTQTIIHIKGISFLTGKVSKDMYKLAGQYIMKDGQVAIIENEN